MLNNLYRNLKRRFDFMWLSPRFKFLMKEIGLSPKQIEKKESMEKNKTKAGVIDYLIGAIFVRRWKIVLDNSYEECLKLEVWINQRKLNHLPEMGQPNIKPVVPRETKKTLKNIASQLDDINGGDK